MLMIKTDTERDCKLLFDAYTVYIVAFDVLYAEVLLSIPVSSLKVMNENRD